jgi:2-hydroxyisobutanoyl-CoA mutase large subunit
MSVAGPPQDANRPPGGSAAREPDGPSRGRTPERGARSSSNQPQARGDHASDIATGASAGPDPRVREALAAEVDAWEKNEVAGFIERAPERAGNFETLGGFPLKRVYTALDIADTPLDDIGLPGRYPFTRGPYPTMYRGRVWTMRQIAGFGTAEDTNQRFKYLIAHGQTGLSTDFDMPTLMGYDSDHPMSEGEVGREGVAIDTLADMEHLFDGIDLTKISVSMTINPSAWILLAMYVALAQKRGYDLHALSGTIQADILKEYQAQKEWAFPVAPSVRIVRDCITYCARNMKRYNPINISGYHISEAGASPLDEVAFTMCNLVAYVEEVLKTGMHVDEFAPRLAFYYVSQSDFFEEIAKFRAARRVYAKIMRERFGAANPESMRLRFHCQTAAASLTKPQYRINVVRTSLQALAAVLGGAQSLHTNGMDEAFAIPTEEAMKIALRTQQVIADESGVAGVVDPLGGSYFVESLTTQYERAIFAVLDEVDRNGGTIKLTQEGWFQRRIADFAYETALKKADGDKPVIGVNKYVDPQEKLDIALHPYDATTAKRQIDRLQRVRRERDNAKVIALLDRLVDVAKDERENLMPVTIELVAAGATMGDIIEKLKTLWGTYRENPVF